VHGAPASEVSGKTLLGAAGKYVTGDGATLSTHGVVAVAAHL